jgi:hypothetical protein
MVHKTGIIATKVEVISVHRFKAKAEKLEDIFMQLRDCSPLLGSRRYKLQGQNINLY